MRTCRLNANRRLLDFRNLYHVSTVCTRLVHIARPLRGPETVEMRPEAIVLKSIQFNIRPGRAKHKRNQNTVATVGKDVVYVSGPNLKPSADRTNNVYKFYFHSEAHAINRTHTPSPYPTLLECCRGVYRVIRPQASSPKSIYLNSGCLNFKIGTPYPREHTKAVNKITTTTHPLLQPDRL